MRASLLALDPDLRDAAQSLLDAAGAAGLQPRITSTLRSHSEQRRLYSRFLAGQSGYPVAPPGQSAHEYGWAFDMVVSPLEALADVGFTWQSWGGGWNPADAIHFELLGASDLAKQQPSTLAASPVGETVRSWAEWFDTLPWWASVALPASLMTSRKLITYADVQRVALKFGVHL